MTDKLEVILKKYFGLKGNLMLPDEVQTDERCYTDEGYEAYNRMLSCLGEIFELSESEFFTNVKNVYEDELDKIEHLPSY